MWVLRLAWLGTGFALGPAVADALVGADDAVRWTVVVGLYAAWAACLLAALVPRSIGLTAVRVGGPAALAVSVWAVVAGGPAATSDVVAVAWSTFVAVMSLVGTTADAMVDGSSYGAERRFALRVPLVVLLGPAEAAWAVAVAGLASGPLLLASGRAALGIVALLVGWPLAVVAVRALHQLSRRWVVFVPAGVVLHDPLATNDPALFPRPVVAGLGPALAADIDAPSTLDLSGGAPGLVLELRLHQPVPVGVRRRGRRSQTGTDVAAGRVRFIPVRPGAVLAEAARRRLARVD
jgi:hypothetical protein